MKIGITYDLRKDYLAAGFGEEETAEFDSETTIAAIDQTLQDLGYRTDRIGNIKSLTRRLAAGHSWDLVFNIAEGLRGFGREAQVPALLEAHEIPYTFSDPLVLSLTLHKGMAKRVVRDLGVPTPDFFLVENESDLASVDLPFPLFAKPVAEGTGKGVDSASKITNRRDLLSVCSLLLSRYKQPVLVETFLPGREVTVGILGTGKDAAVIGAMEVVLLENAESEVYSYRNKEKFEELVEYRPVDGALLTEASKVALLAWRGLGCRDAGRLDLRQDRDGNLMFMEVNPLAGLHPIRSDLCIIATQAGISYSDLIQAIVSSASARHGLRRRSFEEKKGRYRPQPTSLRRARKLASIH
ncbi:MAG: D-alanine--D-alanine ligase [Deltaproteobacteria bacterium]|nr:D-alanine--D-alanine ligase [Deltaproteobacteria bacterium]